MDHGYHQIAEMLASRQDVQSWNISTLVLVGIVCLLVGTCIGRWDVSYLGLSYIDIGIAWVKIHITHRAEVNVLRTILGACGVPLQIASDNDALLLSTALGAGISALAFRRRNDREQQPAITTYGAPTTHAATYAAPALQYASPQQQIVSYAAPQQLVAYA